MSRVGTCVKCGIEFELAKRGRPASKCPACRPVNGYEPVSFWQEFGRYMVGERNHAPKGMYHGIQRVCAQCNKPYAQKLKNQGQKYCSRECHMKAHRADEKPCMGCGALMPDKAAGSKNRRLYCSRRCGTIHTLFEGSNVFPLSKAKAYYDQEVARQEKEAGYLMRPCLKCGVEVRSFRNRAGPSRCDKKECRAYYSWVTGPRGRVRTCPYCDVQWCAVHKAKHGNREACSQECQDALYREQQREQKNARRRVQQHGVKRNGPVNRRRVMARDNYQCQACGTQVPRLWDVNNPKSGELDHIVPISKGGEHSEANLQVLCRRCNQLKSDRDDVMFKALLRFILINQGDSPSSGVRAQQ